MLPNIGIKQLLCGLTLAVAMTFTASAQTKSTAISEGPGYIDRTTSVTGVEGRTATYQNNHSWGNGAYNDTRSYTGRNGGTVSDTKTRSGGVVTNTATGRHGNSRTWSRPARYRR
jgi:hypothetical protein